MSLLPTIANIWVMSLATKCGIAGENQPTGAKFPMEIIDLQAIKEIFARILLLAILVMGHLHFTGTKLKSSYLMMGMTSGHSDGHVTLV